MTPETAHPIRDTPFVNELRLDARQWLVVAGLVLVTLLALPRLWTHLERFETGPDYRIPYALSKDYWLYARRLDQPAAPGQVTVLGDSVMWGEYVLPDGTLPHFLNLSAGATNRFLNAGVNGLYPLALEGLVKHYGSALHGRKILLHCNPLWLSSPKADLQAEQDGDLNHAHLLPQFFPRIPAYKADANERLGALVERNVRFFAWAGHLQDAYYGQQNEMNWTLAEGNAYRNPLAQLTLTVPAAPRDDAKRGPRSRRHRPWTATGDGPTQLAWVSLESSLQWAAFQRTVALLRARGNEVLVLVGPFNEHMLTADNRAAYGRVRAGIVDWLRAQQVPCVAPAPLPSELYADASHPLTEGYRLLAEQLFQDSTFQAWQK
jgi:hypothetical protein